jgi:3-hydroxyisobutyrate dehydrogenase-like beta-hydroxyacid dehydrogenase
VNRVLGFIGFGEAGFNIAKGLRGAGIGQICAFDIHTHTPGTGERIQARAQETATALLASPAELAATADIIFSTVTASAALEAAEQIQASLRSHHFYADLNSVSPALKQNIERVITGSGAHFIEVAVMAPVPPYAHRVPMLLGGPAASEFAELLSPFGMRFEVVSETVGRAAAVKMFRSIVVKGLEALLLECVLGASVYGAEQRVFESLSETFPRIDWNKLADYMIGRVVAHGERRAHEMEEVAETLRRIGIDPIMSEATARRQAWCAGLDLRSQFGGNAPDNYRDVLRAIANVTAM